MARINEVEQKLGIEIVNFLEKNNFNYIIDGVLNIYVDMKLINKDTNINSNFLIEPNAFYAIKKQFKSRIFKSKVNSMIHYISSDEDPKKVSRIRILLNATPEKIDSFVNPWNKFLRIFTFNYWTVEKAIKFFQNDKNTGYYILSKKTKKSTINWWPSFDWNKTFKHSISKNWIVNVSNDLEWLNIKNYTKDYKLIFKQKRVIPNEK
ncbi:MAG: hypothetical protein K4H23_05375 [Mollicutes bacterium PWAP]|nr:hypothetical protein [Mollicutes bacterium PWAP]